MDISGNCSKQIAVSLSGRVYQELSKYAGTYERMFNETYPYWVKNDTALWLDQTNGNWKIGSLDSLGSTRANMYSEFLTLCPESLSVSWRSYYNLEWNEDYYNHINVTAV